MSKTKSKSKIAFDSTWKLILGLTLLFFIGKALGNR